MARNVREVDGPSIFSARGVPKSLQICWNVVKFSWHDIEEAGPIVRKSSRQWNDKDTRCCLAIHASKSATMLNSLGADRSPKGRQLSMYKHAAKVVRCGRSFASSMYWTADRVRELTLYSTYNLIKGTLSQICSHRTHFSSVGTALAFL